MHSPYLVRERLQHVEANPAKGRHEQREDDSNTVVALSDLGDLGGGLCALSREHGGGGDAQADGRDDAALDVLLILNHLVHLHGISWVFQDLAMRTHEPLKTPSSPHVQKCPSRKAVYLVEERLQHVEAHPAKDRHKKREDDPDTVIGLSDRSDQLLGC